MWFEDYQWHYDYVRLAWDTGFSFDKSKSPNLDKNKICIVDVDRIVKERDVASVDRYISTVVQYILEDEQAKVLDINFVKIFRISQLAVEYLLFCKKYLDNTVVLLKKELTKNREENKELKAFIDDLQKHVETLAKQQVFTTFKCSVCSKVFSSEEYLNAHVKRRHNSHSGESYNSETDKLNLEIKELKERLNNTEKLLKDKDEQNPEKKLLDLSVDNSKMTELLEKFEMFKNQVDNELKELKIQKSFYEENYGKLFDIVIQNKENIEPKNQIKDIPKTETTTQTDKMLHIENVNNKNILEIHEQMSSSEDVNTNNVARPQTEKESLEVRISTTLAGIEDQMQVFWNKLNEIEENKPNKGNLQSGLPDEIGDNKLVMEERRPRAKPRSKLSQPTHHTGSFNNNAEKLKTAIEELEQQQKEQLRSQELPINRNKPSSSEEKNYTKLDYPSLSNINIAHNQPEEESVSASSESSPSESVSEPIQNQKIVLTESNRGKHIRQIRIPEYSSESPKLKGNVIVKPPATSTDKHSHSSTKKVTLNKSMANLNEEIEAMVCDRLNELGISESWTRLPEKSFEKAMEIINHQATLTKKNLPNFNAVKKKINNEIEKKISNEKGNIKTSLGKPPATPKLEKIQNIVKVAYRPKSGKKDVDQRKSILSPKRETVVEIKNRALYDTDTESEQNFKQSRSKPPSNTNARNSHRWYTNVVEELKSLPNPKSQTDEDSLDELNKDAQKGVLKSFPSVGSLAKKKVLFDLESDSGKLLAEPIVQKTGGSTTSIASSILGEKIDSTKVEDSDKEKLNVKNIEKELDDLSDFDLSDI